MDVVAAGMHNADLASGLVAGSDFTSVREPRFLDNGQCIHIRTDQNDGPRPIFQNSHNPMSANARRHLSPGLCELFANPL